MKGHPPSTEAPGDRGPHAAIRDFYDGTYYAGSHADYAPNWHLARVARRLGSLEGRSGCSSSCRTQIS